MLKYFLPFLEETTLSKPFGGLFFLKKYKHCDFVVLSKHCTVCLGLA